MIKRLESKSIKHRKVRTKGNLDTYLREALLVDNVKRVKESSMTGSRNRDLIVCGMPGKRKKHHEGEKRDTVKMPIHLLGDSASKNRCSQHNYGAFTGSTQAIKRIRNAGETNRVIKEYLKARNANCE